MSVPVLSLAGRTGPAPAVLADALHAALVDTGFVVLVDHGIDLGSLHAAYAAVEAFFALPEATKAAYQVGVDGQRGYTPFGREHAKDSPHPDLKEFWHVGREAIRPNVWPAEIADFRQHVEWLYDALDAAGLWLLDALCRPLGIAAGTLTDLAVEGNSVLRLLHYPPIPAGADPRAVRAAAHEDINLITLLVSASASGLELLDRGGRWRAIEAPADAIIADAGDMLARITHHHIPATTHRVVNPTGPNRSRYSMPFFLHPRPEAVLSCLPPFRTPAAAPDITAADFLAQRLAAIGLA